MYLLDVFLIDYLLIVCDMQRQARGTSLDAYINPGGFIDLPHDIILNILSRVPVLFLVRLKSVCTFRYKVIQSTTLIYMHLDREIKTSSYLVENPKYENMFVMEEEANIVKVTTIGHSLGQATFWCTVNGLLCYSTYPTNQSYKEVINICNPITKKCIIFQQCDRAPLTGFGFEPLTKQYKVLRMLNVISSDHMAPFRCEIRTLGNGFWRQIESVPYQPEMQFIFVCVDGFLYWIVASISLKVHTFI
ncbi:putative F-box protein At1g19160 [Tasmannia lanceolata]|uniref:putative F-box protein At1g19160 n=1 Tax=Tasmannia lanceolata TaxID=3420 RepID=UPI0040638ABE